MQAWGKSGFLKATARCRVSTLTLMLVVVGVLPLLTGLRGGQESRHECQASPPTRPVGIKTDTKRVTAVVLRMGPERQLSRRADRLSPARRAYGLDRGMPRYFPPPRHSIWTWRGSFRNGWADLAADQQGAGLRSAARFIASRCRGKACAGRP